jgi:PAS domain S-box-containing protein
MRSLATKTRELEEAARRESAQQSLRLTQLAILREIARTIVRQLDLQELTAAVTEQLQRALGYDHVSISLDPLAPRPQPTDAVETCIIQDAEGPLGHLVVDNSASGRVIDPSERELLEMLSEYLAIAIRNSRLYGEITDTKRSLEQLIASAGDAIIAVDLADRVDGWNPAAERIFGLAAETAIGRPIADLLPGPRYADAKRRLREGATLQAFEISTTVDGGRTAELAVTLSALHDRQGDLERLIAIVRDITTQRQVERQLHQSEKLTALGQLAGGIAHDFNNLLQAILGYAQLLKQNPGNEELTERSLRTIESAALDGSETVRRIQQFARLRPDEEFVTLDVNQIIEGAVAITQPRWAETVARENRPLSLALDLDPVPTINGRSAALTEMMTNLILNAIDAMPAGGTLSISTRPGDGSTVVVTVRDTGTGMPESVRQRIFEPFFSTKGEGGSGLGLAMTYSIVKRHGGEIEVASEPGAGTAFTLTFPAATGEVATAREGSTPTARRTARILLVDNDAQVRSTLTDLLQSLGHAIEPMPGGAEALAAYAPGRFDAVITNLGMPGMNGWELARRVREVDRSVAILFITGWGLRDDDHARVTELNIQRCLFKPVHPAELDSALQAALPS